MARKLYIPLSAAVAGALIAASPASAVTCEQLPTALESAAPGSTVIVDQGLTCTGSYDLPSHQITLAGAGTGATLRGDGESRILEGDDVSTTTIRNLRFTNGSAGESGGGAILVTGNSPITVADSTFTDNSASGRGGAVNVNGFPFGESNDRARVGEAQQVRILRSTFGGAGDLENTSESGGGAVNVDFIPVEVSGSTFRGNIADSGGGGLSAFVFGPITLTGNTFTNNTAGGSGGGAEIGACEAVVRDNAFTGNVADALGGGKGSGGSAEGGGLWADAFCPQEQAPQARALGIQEVPALEQSGNTFEANALDVGSNGRGRGGGEYVTGFALTSTNDTFHDNEIAGEGADGAGAGLNLDAWRGEPAVGRNLVATANRMPDGDGGAINYSTDTSRGGDLRLTHATLAANDAGDGDGGAINGGSDDRLVLHNSIVHGNAQGPEGEEISGFEQQDVANRGGPVSGTREIRFTLACDGSVAFDGAGNLCADPKLANAAEGDVHQTAASQTLEKASADLVDGLQTDYEGHGRSIDYDRTGGAQPDMGADEALAPELPEETQQQEQQPQPAPAASGGVLGTQVRRCTSRRSFRIKLRNRGQKVVKATVIVNGKRVKVLRGKRLTSRVNLRGLPKGRFTVRIRLELADGRKVSGVRRYFTCRPGRRSGPPPV